MWRTRQVQRDQSTSVYPRCAAGSEHAGVHVRSWRRLPLSTGPAWTPLSLHVFSRQVGRRCVALEVNLPQDISSSSLLATVLSSSPEFDDASGAWSPFHSSRATGY